MPIEMAMIELIGVTEKAVIARCRAALGPARHLLARGRAKMQQAERRPREPGKGAGLLDQPLPDADPAFGRLPENDPPLLLAGNQLDLDFLLLDLVIELDRTPQ